MISLKSTHPLGSLLVRSQLNVLGINSGTSIDGLDLCLIQVRDRQEDRPRIKFLAARSYRFPAPLRDTLRALARDESVQKRIAAVAHLEFADWTAACVQRFSRTWARSTPIDLIGFHGQTIAHYPRGGTRSKARAIWQGDATWQIGAPALLAQRAGAVTVGDFRTADVAAGGMGAPLSGYYHYLMFGGRYAVLNIGGIANISVAREGQHGLEIRAFDIGPGNMVIDAVSMLTTGREFDRGGRLAVRGVVDFRVMERALSHPYFRQAPPKTCGREEFGEPTVRRWFGRRLRDRSATADCCATAMEITVRLISDAIRRWVEPLSPVRTLIVSGGGAKNDALMRALRSRLAGWGVVDTKRFDLDAQYVEPAGFALLAHETLRGRPGNDGGATGADAAILGSIYLPMN